MPHRDGEGDAHAEVEIGRAYIGTELDGRYLIEDILGHGGMGTVFRAEQILMKKQVAIKLLHADLAARKQVVGRFTREARAISRLSSPHTVRVFDFGRWKDLFYLVMELLDGETLDALLNRTGAMPYPRVVELVAQMCDSLGEAHAAGIVHRDLKPENIVLARQDGGAEVVKILDFGLAKISDQEDLYSVHSKTDLFGTPYYMSPEQIKAGEVDGRSDIYSVGALMFRMLTGTLLHGGAQGTFEILRAHLSDKPPRLADVAPAGTQIPAALEAIVVKCLHKSPDDRYQTMAELAQALADAQAAGWQLAPTPTAAHAAVVEEPEPQPSRTALWRTLVFVGVLALLAAGVAVLMSGHAAPVPGEEVEPNDDARQPGLLAPDGTATGVLGKRRSPTQADLDCYRLPVLPSGHVPTVLVTGLPNMDLRLSLHDKDGDERLVVNHRGRGQGELLQWPDPRLPVTTVCVTEHVAPDGVASESLSDHYKLTVTSAPRTETTEREPNDLAPGEPLAAGASRTGTLEGPLDRDVYRLEGAVDGRLVWLALDLGAGAPTGAHLTLLDQAGRMVAAQAMRPGEQHLALGFVPTGDQIPDRVVVERVGRKDLPLSAEALPYTLTYTHRDVTELAEVAPNNTPETATPLALGTWTQGQVDGGEDWVRLEGGDPSLARVRLEVRAPGAVGVQMTVRDVGQQVDLRTIDVPAGQTQELVLTGSGDGVVVRLRALVQAGKGKVATPPGTAVPWGVRARYLSGVVTK